MLESTLVERYEKAKLAEPIAKAATLGLIMHAVNNFTCESCRGEIMAQIEERRK